MATSNATFVGARHLLSSQHININEPLIEELPSVKVKFWVKTASFLNFITSTSKSSLIFLIGVETSFVAAPLETTGVRPGTSLERTGEFTI